MSKILLVGNDFRLLTTRAAVLSQTKASVAFCNALEARQILQGESLDLVVLCHSLTELQAAEIIEMTRQRSPAAKTLMIVSDPSQDCSPNGVSFDAMISSDPDGLVRRTSELLQQSSQPV